MCAFRGSAGQAGGRAGWRARMMGKKGVVAPSSFLSPLWCRCRWSGWGGGEQCGNGYVRQTEIGKGMCVDGRKKREASGPREGAHVSCVDVSVGKMGMGLGEKGKSEEEAGVQQRRNNCEPGLWTCFLADWGLLLQSTNRNQNRIYYMEPTSATHVYVSFPWFYFSLWCRLPCMGALAP